MKQSLRILVVLLALALTATACSTAKPPEPSPSPTVTPSPMPSPTPTATVMPTPTAALIPSASAPSAAARKVGNNIALYVGTTKITGEAYYDARNVMVFPLQAVSKAMGWQVKTGMGASASSSPMAASTPAATAGTSGQIQTPKQETLTLTKGAETITVQFMTPAGDTDEATQVSAKKGATSLTVDTKLLCINGELYVPEAFIDSALGQVDVTFNNTDKITITPKA